MNRRDIVIGLVILAVLAGVILFRSQQTSEEDELRVPQTLSVEDQIEGKFNLQIPDDVEKAELKDATGSDASAIATRKFENGTFMLTVLADLPGPETGAYQAYLLKDGEERPVGSLRIAKGGYLLEYQSAVDMSDYSDVKVMLGETTVLEGEF